MYLEARIAAERKIVRTLVKSALARGYTVSVFDSEEWTLKRSSNLTEIIKATFTTDDDQLLFHNKDGEKVGAVHLCYGNSGYDVIADHSDNPAMEELLAEANAVATKIEMNA